MVYLNYVFSDLKYDDGSISGSFIDKETGIHCRFRFDRKLGTCVITDNNRPVAEIGNLPIGFLLNKLETDGKIDIKESHISY